MASPFHLEVVKLSDQATPPTPGSLGSAGLDLYSSHDLTIPGRGKGLVDTQLIMRFPIGTYGRIAPRSGLSW